MELSGNAKSHRRTRSAGALAAALHRTLFHTFHQVPLANCWELFQRPHFSFMGGHEVLELLLRVVAVSARAVQIHPEVYPESESAWF